MNMLSQEIVNKSQLFMEKHPQPYKGDQVNCFFFVSISKRCLVTFETESSKDSIWYDVNHVILMKLTYILLR